MTIYRLGSRGMGVKQIQKALHLLADGIYGPATMEAVATFQKENGLKADGITGPATLAKLLPVRIKMSKRPIKEIIIHCTATPEGRAVTPAEIRNWHKARGFSDIGYHYIIGLNGEIWTGRDVDIQGAHCADGGHNRYSIGVCYVGGLTRDGKTNKDTRTLKQKAALLSLLYDLKKFYPEAGIYGHCDFDQHGKTCPNFKAKNEYRNL